MDRGKESIKTNDNWSQKRDISHEKNNKNLNLPHLNLWSTLLVVNKPWESGSVRYTSAHPCYSVIAIYTTGKVKKKKKEKLSSLI